MTLRSILTIIKIFEYLLYAKYYSKTTMNMTQDLHGRTHDLKFIYPNNLINIYTWMSNIHLKIEN